MPRPALPLGFTAATLWATTIISTHANWDTSTHQALVGLAASASIITGIFIAAGSARKNTDRFRASIDKKLGVIREDVDELLKYTEVSRILEAARTSPPENTSPPDAPIGPVLTINTRLDDGTEIIAGAEPGVVIDLDTVRREIRQTGRTA